MALLSQKPVQRLAALCGLARRTLPFLSHLNSLCLEIQAIDLFGKKVLPCTSGEQPRAVANACIVF